MFEQTFKNIDDILYKDAGADSELDYIEQTSWVLFLRYLDELEREKADEEALKGKDYQFILDEEYRWPNWAMPKTSDGKLDHHKTMTGPDLVRFVDLKLFPYLAGFKQKTENPKTIEYKIGEIFSELNNKIKSGYNLREIIEMIDELPFGSSKDKHELSHLYETKIKNMGNAGRNGGQYYTPRPLIRAIIDVTSPQVGEKIYDAACGSAGFLCEAYAYMYDRMERNTTNLKKLQENTLYGKEKKNLAYIIGVMNMILHGIEAPNIIHTNTLTENIRDIQEKDRFNVILANPPFGGKERKEVQQNFDIKTGETAFLFLQHFIKSLKVGGRAGIVVKNTVLNNSDNSTISLRRYLLETCNLHTILDMPAGTFLGAGVKTVVLFFIKGEPTKTIWYYQLGPGRNMGKTNPLNDNDMKDFLNLQKNKKSTLQSWSIDIQDIDRITFDLSVKNPNKQNTIEIKSPYLIKQEIQELDISGNQILLNVYNYLENTFKVLESEFPAKKIGDVCKVIAGQSPEGKFYNSDGKGMPFYQGKKEFTSKYIGEPTTWTTDITKEAVKDDVLMSVRAPVGPVNFATQKCCIGRGLAAIRATSKIDKEFLFYYFLKNEKEITGNEGAVFNSINKNQIENLMIPVPPIEIQKEIVNSLNLLFEDLDSLEKLYINKVEKIRELKMSIMHSAYYVNGKTKNI